MTGGAWLEELGLVAAVFLLAGFVAWLGFRHAGRLLEVRRERERTIREAITRMDSPDRIAAFLGSAEGRALLGEVPLAERARATGLVLLGGAAFSGALGLALLVIAGRHAGAVDPAAVAGREDAFFWGVILLALGAAAAVLAGALRSLASPGKRRPASDGPSGDG